MKARADAVEAKGKGLLNTFWLDLSTKGGSSVTLSDAESRASDTVLQAQVPDFKQDQLVDWMVELLLDHIKMIVSLVPASPHVSVILHLRCYR